MTDCDGLGVALLYDKLFEYQRTGVRGLWRLHSQGFGGVVRHKLAARFARVAVVMSSDGYSIVTVAAGG